MKLITDKKEAQRIINNVKKLRKEGADSIRLVQGSNGDNYFLCRNKDESEIHLVSADDCTLQGVIAYEINKEINSAKIMAMKVFLPSDNHELETKMFLFLESELKQLKVKQIFLDARTRAGVGDWYKELGYKQISLYNRTENRFVKTHLKNNRGIKKLANVIDPAVQLELSSSKFKFLGASRKAKSNKLEMNRALF